MSALVLATNSGYAPEISQGFIDNLRTKGYTDEIALFDVPQTSLPLCTQRFYEYRNFLRERPESYDTVILSDLRDVLFQADPRNIEHGELDCFLEWEGITIGACPFNSHWIRTGFGQNELDSIADRPISCAGFTIGTQQGVERYISLLIEVVERMGQTFAGADQGIHNWLIHKKILPCQLHANEAGAVYTVGHVPSILVRNHTILNRAGEMPVVVHQYDRHLRLV